MKKKVLKSNSLISLKGVEERYSEAIDKADRVLKDSSRDVYRLQESLDALEDLGDEVFSSRNFFNDERVKELCEYISKVEGTLNETLYGQGIVRKPSGVGLFRKLISGRFVSGKINPLSEPAEEEQRRFLTSLVS
jgi:hypothetical protein